MTLVYVLKPYIPTFGVVYLEYVYRFAWSFALGSVIYFLNIDKMSKWYAAVLTAMTIPGIFYCVYFDKSDNAIVAAAILVVLYIIIPNKKISLAECFSKNSFGIYLFHSPLIYITFRYMLNAEPMIVVLVNFVFFGGISLLMTHYVRKTPLKIIVGE